MSILYRQQLLWIVTNTRKAHKLWASGRRCAGKLFGRQILMGIHLISTKYFGAFATTLISQRISIQCFAQSATVWP